MSGIAINNSIADRIGLTFATVCSVPVVAPFFHVAAHVVDAEFVGQLGCHRAWLSIGIVFVPSHIVYVVSAAIQASYTFVATFGSIFPLGLGRQTEYFVT